MTTGEQRTARAAVIGVGTRYRHDDGIGHVVADRIHALRLPGVRIVHCHGEPTELMDAWAGAPLVVVVDAVRRDPGRPGSLYRVEVGSGLAGTEPLACASSHGLGVAETVALARTLGRLPRRLVLLGVQAGDLTAGVGFSHPVVAALPALVALTRTVLDECASIGSTKKGVDKYATGA